ncbi:hypothetical protein E3Q22_03362 [Wallemia mellicola]|uniref:S1 motif domain-containing protein n=2 Tax=Wallemia mellicola TaxID=1708541 RepID=I4Y9T7_WALMC|nr:hypothetical protein WALSEDRAFT_69646 [Wallemia mellicola CBS 633.66]EIM20729.1 hypothetical protein WALSEDRAFT_69646 [Wallemia mellicola CBS 633.66]TIB76820.1 hypothetical protein E3Q22_03362 [Wallemia mellicola]TIB96295.1 hypothetical protein E3Q18_03224 [Wallemia mellicola]|eukprot:XP_006959260.1 hypothetical protein WALSEDRAFT_69646 [Wallemia mellicola CBS 633.66]
MVKRKSEASDTTSVLKSASTKKHKTFDNAGDSSIGAEVDFPRGGGTGLTAVETAQAKHEGRKEADRDAKLKKKPSVKKQKKTKESSSDKKEKKDIIRVEHLNYRRALPGLKVLCQIVHITAIDLIVSLPEQLLAHIPITNISTHFTQRLDSAMNDDSDDGKSVSDDGNEDLPELDELFQVGQWLRATVLHVHKDSNTGRVKKEGEEIIKASRKLELSIDPRSVNDGLTQKDLEKDFTIVGAVRSVEDHGYLVDLGVPDVDGFVSTTEMDASGFDKELAGQVGSILPLTVTSKSNKVVNLSPNPSTFAKSYMNEANTLESVIPGVVLNAMVTAVLPAGLNVKFFGFFDGTISKEHIPYEKKSLSERFPVGKKVKARVIFDHPTSNPKRFSLSLLPHIVNLQNSLTEKSEDGLTIAEAFGKGRIIEGVQVITVESEKGLYVTIPDSELLGFVHISQIADDHTPSLSSSSGATKVGSLHTARVVGLSYVDKIVQLSIKPSVLEKSFMKVSDAEVGAIVDGIVKKIADDRMFISISGNVDAIVWPTHYSDVKLKHPEKKYRSDMKVKARILTAEADKNRVTATLKKSLVKSDLPIITSYDASNKNVITYATVSGIKEKGAIVDFYNNVRAFLPVGEISESYTKHAKDALEVGQIVKVIIVKVEAEAKRMMASIRKTVPKEEREALIKERKAEQKDKSPAVVDEEDEEDVNAETMQIDGEIASKDDSESEDGSVQGLEIDEESSEEEEDEDEDEVTIDTTNKKPKMSTKEAKALDIGGFNWDGDDNDDEKKSNGSDEEDEDSDAESTNNDDGKRKKKRKGTKHFEGDLTALMNEKPPESSNDFERLLLGSPNSSYVWIQYMSFQLKLSEIDKAREIAKRALKTIGFRESQEKFNIWIALLNLENTFGDDDSFEEVFKDATSYNDPLTMHLKVADILEASEKFDKASDVYVKSSKKFGAEVIFWVNYAEYNFRIGNQTAARSLLTRSLQSLEKRDHISCISKFAQMEFRLGDAERGKTIFEGIVESHPKQLDQWFIYVDMLSRKEDLGGLRNVFERLLSHKLSTKKAKSVFKKWLTIEKELGDESGIDDVKQRAVAWNEQRHDD